MTDALSKETLTFLTDLNKNNNREWFTCNKSRYLVAQENMVNFVDALIQEISDFDEAVLKIDAKKSIFRIYRDTRFSKDKTPYKTNFGAGLGMGKGSEIAGYYLHIEPGKSFLAGGVYQPDSSILKEIRREISVNADEFLAIINGSEFRKYFTGLSEEDKLIRVPAGFDKDDPMAEVLKLKSYIAVYNLTDREILEKDAVKKLADMFKQVKPLNDFLSGPFKKQ